MPNPMLALIEGRISANRFDGSYALSDGEIEELTRLATRAPTAYNLQNWRFIAVRGQQAREKLAVHAYGQTKVREAAVTFIVCGALPDPATIPTRLLPSIEAGFIPATLASAWEESARAQYADAKRARDEAVRSAALGAATLIYAAGAMGLASCPIGGFDPEGTAREFGLHADEIAVMLVAVGRAAPGNWPPKARRPLSETLEIA